MRCGFKTFLADYDFLDVVHAVGDVDEAIKYIKSNPVDILISEMSFTNVSPIDLIGKVKSINPEINVVFFTTQDQQIYSVPLLRAGAIGFLSKNINQKTVNTYKNRMMHKLNVNNMFDLYLQAKNMNLV